MMYAYTVLINDFYQLHVLSLRFCLLVKLCRYSKPLTPAVLTHLSQAIQTVQVRTFMMLHTGTFYGL